jgi:hypothetical protein
MEDRVIVFRRELPALPLPSARAAFAAPGSAAGGRVRVPALLFSAGDYPDKGVTITVEDLDGLVSHWSANGRKPVPVQVEHIPTALDPLGEVVAFHREGSDLYGTLVFSEGLYSHLVERGAKHVSLSLLAQPEGSEVRFSIKEASIVLEPRVPGAGFLTEEQVGAVLAKFSASGQLTPAMVPHVRALLSAPATVTFSDGSSVSVAAEVQALLSALPVVQPRASAAGGVPPLDFGRAANTPRGSDLAPEVRRMVASLGADPDTIAAQLAAGGGR